MHALTPESMAQAAALMAGAPNPPKATVVLVRQDGDDHIFDVACTGHDGASFSMRETVRQIDGVRKIIKLERPS